MSIESILRRKGTDVTTIAPEASIKSAADWLRAKNIGALVVTSGNAVLGLISEREIDRHDGFDLSALARAIEHATEIHGGRNRGHARVASGICNARLGVCLERSCRPRRQLKHRRLLTLT